ncbi:MAG: FAD-binding and (Fe-S)-binding domain-containing protein [Paralcaligenes sp.]
MNQLIEPSRQTLVWDALESDLANALGEVVHFDKLHKSLYASDASNYRQVPIGVVVPRTIEEFVAASAICYRHQVPVLMRGGGTSQNGQCVNVAVVFDMSKYCNRILELDPQAGTAVVEPGIICDTLRDAAEVHELTFAPDPATHSRCTVGGMIGNNSCGAHSVMAGKTVENIEALEVMTYDGERFWVGPTTDAELTEIIAAGGRRGQIYADLKGLSDKYGNLIRARFPNIKRRVSGYNLDQLLPENGFNVARALVGTEGTCALTLKARVRLVKSPQKRVLLILGFDDIYLAADAVPEYMPFGPIAIEGLDRQIIRGLQARQLRAEEIALLPEGDAWVIVEFGADTVEAAMAQAQRAADYFNHRPGSRVSTKLIADGTTQTRVWLIRETGASATAISIEPGRPDPLVGWEDAAVDPMRLGDYLRTFQALVARYGYETSLYGHFGDGCVHARITFDTRSIAGVAKWREFTREAAELVVEFGGSLSGEHGDGQAKAEFLPIMFGAELMLALEEFKRIWDPDNRLNPGKVVFANKMDENLRVGPDYKVVKPVTRMQFINPEGTGFQREMERCIGMGRCRSLKGNTMCPSYRATRDEKYSTRGRAHVLWEMLQGEIITDGWQSTEVKEALDTCLACKGCRSDCPTHVDMASYKAEFLSHFYEKKTRPRQAWSMGRIGDWAPWAARLPGLSNFFTQTPWLAGFAKKLAGVAAGRSLPKFSRHTFRHGYRAAASLGRPRVMLWVDTFCEHFHPDVARAAQKVLEHAGFHVVLPAKKLCCGRPLYDFGYLDAAKRRLQQIINTIGSSFENGQAGPVALVGLEPGCMSVFKDELVKMFPGDSRARRIADNAWLLSDFLVSRNYQPPRLDVEVMIHTHCHQKALFGVKGDQELLNRMGARWTQLDSGCCGMAGSFGFNPDHEALSRNIGEQVLFPALRAAKPDTIVLTNGFSCKEQIKQGVCRDTLHIAELLLRAQTQQSSLINQEFGST